MKWVMYFSRTVIPKAFGCFVQKFYIYFLKSESTFNSSFVSKGFASDSFIGLYSTDGKCMGWPYLCLTVSVRKQIL